MNTLKKALATAAVAAVPALAAVPAQAEVLLKNDENQDYGLAALYDDGLFYAYTTLFTLPNPIEPHGGLRLTFDAAATGPGAVQVSMMQVQTGVEFHCDEEGIICSDQTVYTLVPGTESATKTINFTAGTGQHSIDFDGYTVSGGDDYAILISPVSQDGPFSVGLHVASPESIIGGVDGLFTSTPDLNTFYQATGGVYAPNVGLGFKIETLPAVPEPKDYALFLAGLGLVGLAARRRMVAPSASI